nr:E3 ubiquitin-protein ligase RBBP6-like isoform X1 [Danio rerio]|eukprot:XP_021327794.1 E3 ubiquitin-protein ligase RBBP6-like isoform X1 [Danio rerio]
MSCVHYRFQSRLTYDSLQFEGLNISAGELKRQIMRSKRLKFCQLKISNAQTDEEYTDDALIPKNTSVIIRRIPAAGLKSSNRRFVGHQAGRWREPSPRADPSLLSLEQLLKGSRSAPHKRIRKSTGIPSSFLLEVDDPDRKGVMIDGSGRYVIPIIDAEAYAAEKRKRPSFSCQTEPLPSSSSAGAASSVRDAGGKRSRSPSSPETRGDQKRPRR